MSKSLSWFLEVLVLALLQVRYPAATLTETKTVYGQDPSYQIYQEYRYAYDTYGYLFLSENTGADGPESAGLVSAADLAGDAYGGGTADGSGGTKAGSGAGSGGAGMADGAGGTGTAGGGDAAAAASALAAGSQITMAQLQDYDYLMKHFYSVHTSTTAGRDVMKAETLLGTDLKLEKDSSVPQILIYHTHSQEEYADFGPSNPGATVVGNGDYLAELLRAKGWNVIHDTGTYDIQGGKLDRNRAYTYALEGITRILQENPTIQVILDLHRDGVKESLHLVHEVNGKPTANIMFFQGMSRTPEGAIEYLPNPYLEENLAFGFQMQLAAAGRYPGFTRKIYLKGLRYNLHLRPRSALIEVGAQNNTSEEALNAMEPLAELLDIVLQGS
ncbi:stage II sporulation protein P [Clostridium sp. AN503]|uniref:stage II sporulation protein P n=1 Tax=Clostridium sp. AN503 TaxID=3160598 RepID=UPI00345ABF55